MTLTRKFKFKEPRRSFWGRHLLHALVRSLPKHDRAPVFCALPHEFIGREISVRGVYEEAGIAATKWLCEQNIIENSKKKTFLDVGANIGVYSMSLSDAFLETLAYEPHPVTYQILCLNRRINQLENIKEFEFGLSSQDSVMLLSEGTGDNLGGSSVERTTGQGKQHKIELRHAATAVNENTKQQIGFIKIDVEGHESKVISGLSSLLKEQLPVVAFEANDPKHNQALINQFKSLGYTEFLALDYRLKMPNMWLQVLIMTIFGIKSKLRYVTDISKSKYSLVFALQPEAAERFRNL